MQLSWLVPACPSGKNRRIELPGLDLWLLARIDKIFIYPNEFNRVKFDQALTETLSHWPLVTGRFIKAETDRFFIEMSDRPIPVTYLESDDRFAWTDTSPIVTPLDQNRLEPYIDGVDVLKISNGSSEEPLVRFKLSKSVSSGQWIMGVSWSHILGDADALLQFLSTISRFYQSMDAIPPLPKFDRRLWNENEADNEFLPMMKHLTHAGPVLDLFQSYANWNSTFEQVDLFFSGDQLQKLRELAGGTQVTIQDSLSAYLIVTLNLHCYKNDDQRCIRRANTVVNYRGVSDSIAPVGIVSNAIMTMLSENFNDPYCLMNVAKEIRRSIVRARNPEFLQAHLATADGLLRKIVEKNFMANWNSFPNEVIINSNFRYDWCSMVDFGHKENCRLFTAWTAPFYFRIFQSNPRKSGTTQLSRDHHGVEVAFQIEKDTRNKFLQVVENDQRNGFVDLK